MVGRIWNDWGVVGTGARVPNDYMALFKVLDERMKVVQLKTTTRVITALWAEEVSQEACRRQGQDRPCLPLFRRC